MIKKIILSPFQKFVKIETLSGNLLFGATIIALIWANSAYGHYYESLWQLEIGVSFQDFELNKPLILWINDGLMAIFFFLIGLELKRELLIGEINTLKKAAFPFVAAVGGVLIPVAMYLVLNKDPDLTKGWGVPMATDIAFALAILSLLGNRVPLSLKIFLTAFAIIDDIAAVLVIAIFYSGEIDWLLLLYALVIIGLLMTLSLLNKYSKMLSILAAIVVWVLFLKSGIHPTIAGVLMAFTIPIRKKVKLSDYSENLAAISDRLVSSSSANDNIILTREQLEQVDNLEDLTFQVRSPLQHLEHKLHNWAGYFILPIFALSNAGVVISTDSVFDVSLITNIAVALFAGKFIGVALLSYLGIKLKITELPTGVRFNQILGIAAIAGVGFTMSIFIGNLAFAGDMVQSNSVKVGIIIGSLIAGVVGYLLLRYTSNKPEESSK